MITPEPVGAADPETAAAVAEIVSRCSPWVRLRVGAWLACGCGGLWSPDGTPGGDGCISISTDAGYVYAIEAAHHECWHSVESWLSHDALAAVSALAADGLPVPGSYLSDPAERRARMYASLARAWDEGLRMSVGPADRAVAVMHQVYSGDAGRNVLAARARGLRPSPSLPRRIFDALWN